jgi:uncharacterized protein YdhG (YjbR/CyaY superfamily)
MRGAPVATDTDDWLSRLAPELLIDVEKRRAQIRAAAPGAEETISYGQPTFMLHGHLVAFGAFRKHLSFLPMSSGIIAGFPEAAPSVTSKGTMQFQPALVEKTAKARFAENLEPAAERAAAKKKKVAAKTGR